MTAKTKMDAAENDKTMMDAAGNVVPSKYVTPYDKLRDRKARAILARWLKMRDSIEALYVETSENIAAIEMAAVDGRTGARGVGIKGNFQFQSFDGLIAVARAARYELRFDERLAVAQGIIEAIIAEKTAGIDADLAELLRGSFRPTSEGLLSQSRVMGLFRLKIKHPRWSEAMDIIRDSIESRKGKNLISVRRRASRDAEWESILLDVADVKSADPEKVKK